MAEYLFKCTKCKKEVILEMRMNDYDTDENYFHIQSGSKKCGGKMNRHYTNTTAAAVVTPTTTTTQGR